MNIVSQGASDCIMSQNYYQKMRKIRVKKQNTAQKPNQSGGLAKPVLSRGENIILKLTDFQEKKKVFNLCKE